MSQLVGGLSPVRGHLLRPVRRGIGVVAMMIVLAVLSPAPAFADQAGTVTLRGYAGVAEQVFTTENTHQLYTAIGSAGGDTSQFYVSIYPHDWPNTPRTDIYFRMPFNPPAPGTYTAPAGFSYDQPGLTFQGFGLGVFCDGGTFTVNSVNMSNPWGLEYDLSWSQNCNGTPVSGHAVFAAVIPPDTRPPVIDDLWRWEIAETTGTGTEVTFTRTATDDRDPNPVVRCDPPSGSWFPVGLNHTTCVATDNAGNSSQPVQIVVLVLGPDTTPPTFNDTPNIVADATDVNGATVGLWVTASDDRGAVTTVCTRRPGGAPVNPYGWVTFPVNPKGQDTLVTCIATDDAGNQSGPRSFTVHIRGAGEQVEALIATVNDYNLAKLGTSLHDKLVTVNGMLAKGKKPQACEALNSFIKQVNAQDGHGLYEWQAWQLRTAATQIKNVIGC